MPKGRHHQCIPYATPFDNPVPDSCQHCRPHDTDNCGWTSNSSLGTIFNRAWKKHSDQPKYLKDVPSSLPLSTDFLCTDARTVLAFVVCTVQPKKSSDWNPGQLSFKETRIAIEPADGLTICHVRGEFKSYRSELSKVELKRLINGYPPWYREYVQTQSLRIRFPIRSEDDIPRGGWIVAVGLMDRSLLHQFPLAVYRCPNEPAEPGFRENGRTFRQAIVRCRDHIVHHIQPRFALADSSDNKNVRAAVTMLDHLINEKTGSGIPCPGDFTDQWGNEAPLSQPQCRFLMENFNNYKPLTDNDEDNDEDKYKGIILPSMAAVVQGAYAVVQYLKDVGVELKLPKGFEDLDGHVFVKCCPKT